MHLADAQYGKKRKRKDVKKDKIKAKWNASEFEIAKRKELLTLFKNSPIIDDELLMNISLYIKRQDISMMLFMNELYKKILNVHGVVVEFGVRWGRNLALLSSLRSIYEPFNHNRKIVGFDTFKGFLSVDKKDGAAKIITKGAYSVTDNYEQYLTKVLDCHEQLSPISHIKKYQLVKGDASLEIKKYFKNNPETIIALAYFDFDIYQPTKKCLEALKPHLTKGSVIGFDELNVHDYPGETVAFREVFGLGRYKIEHTLFSPTQSFLVVE